LFTLIHYAYYCQTKASDWCNSRRKDIKSIVFGAWSFAFANDEAIDLPDVGTLLEGYNAGVLDVTDDGSLVTREAPDDWVAQDAPAVHVRLVFEAAMFDHVAAATAYYKLSDVRTSRFNSELCRLLVLLRQGIHDDPASASSAIWSEVIPETFPRELYARLRKDVRAAHPHLFDNAA
jgi:hypothetical protein